MKKITAIRAGKGRDNRVIVFLDGKRAFSLETEVVVKGNLRVGQELAESDITGLIGDDNFHRCLSAAAQYLGYRPRSEFELRERLKRRGFNLDCIEVVMDRLKEQGLVDDKAFARFWRDSRESFNPRSQRLTRLELRRKGVAEEVVNKAVDAIDDENSAYRAARNKVGHLSQSDYRSFYRRLGGYLQRRGFDYAVVRHTVETVWREEVGGQESSSSSTERNGVSGINRL